MTPRIPWSCVESLPGARLILGRSVSRDSRSTARGSIRSVTRHLDSPVVDRLLHCGRERLVGLFVHERLNLGVHRVTVAFKIGLEIGHGLVSHVKPFVEVE